MRRLLARIKRAFNRFPDPTDFLLMPRPHTRDEALKAISDISAANDLVYIFFDDRATSDQFLAEMRQAHNMMNNLRQSGMTLPSDYSN